MPDFGLMSILFWALVTGLGAAVVRASTPPREFSVKRLARNTQFGSESLPEAFGRQRASLTKPSVYPFSHCA